MADTTAQQTDTSAQPPILTSGPQNGTGTPPTAGAAGAPTSYKDPTYDQLDAKTSQQLGLPSWLLPSIRTQGEKSNNNQVSSAGAQTVYQITPATRQLALKQYGIDPYLSASNASLVAGKLLSDSMQRNNGSVPQAIGEYIGGTNRQAWGPTTNSYIKRVLQGAGNTPVQPVGGAGSNPYAAASAQGAQTAASVGNGIPNANGANTPAGPSIAKLVDAFNSGAMDQQAAAEFQQDVQNGKVLLPDDVKLTRTVLAPQANGQQGLDTNPQVVPISGAEAASAQQQQQQPGAPSPAAAGAAQAANAQQPGTPAQPVQQQPAPQPVPMKVVQAYQSGQMDAQAKAEFESDIKSGKITLPQGSTPTQQGFLSSVGRQLGLFARDAIQATGNTVGLGYDPIAATLNAATGSHINTAGSQAIQLADTLGLPTPANDRENLVNQATTAGLGGLGFAGAAGGAARGLTGAAGEAASTLAANPAAQTVASAAGGGAGEQARQAGASPIVQDMANVGAAMVAPARVGNVLARGAEMIAPTLTKKIAAIAADDQQPLRQAAAQVAEQIQNTPKDVAFDPATGQVTKEGRELSILSGLTPEGLRKAYGQLETASAGQVQNDTTALGAQHGIQYTKGQATGNFAAQDKEQTLVKSATPEGDQARGFFDQQQQQINQAVDNFKAGFGDAGATPSERGAQVQDAARALRAQGQAGVRSLYEQAAALPGEPVPLETQPIVDAAATAITARPTDPAIKEQIAGTLAKYGLLGGEVTERGPFGNTVTANGKPYQITGEVTPLTLQNAEAMRQQLNRVYGADKTGHTGGVIAALDDSIENAVSNVAQRGNTTAPEVGQQMTHTPAGGTATPVTYAGPGEQPNTARVAVQPPAAPTPEALAAQNSTLAAERDALAAQRTQTGAAAASAEKALTAASGAASAKDRMTALKWAQANQRPDVVQSVLNNARADAETAASSAAPKNPAMMAVQQKAAQQLDKSAQDLHAAAGVPYGAPTEKTVPTSELSGGSQAGAERQQAFEQARAAAKQQKRTYEAKDVIQDLTDYKTGTVTPKVLPENTFNPLFNNPSNLKKAKAVLLGDGEAVPQKGESGNTGQLAWRAIQGQALAHIAENAKNPQSGDYSAARLNSAIAKFGDENLRTLFEPSDYNKLKSLQAAISKTIPLSGTVNHSNTFTKFANLVGSHMADGIAAAGGAVLGAPGMLAGKGLGLIAERIAEQRKNGDILKSVVAPAAPTAAASRARVDKANNDLIDTLINASKKNAFVPYGVTANQDDKQ